jgi:predicted membrane protein
MNRSSGFWWGVVLIVLGAFFLLENLDIVRISDVIRDYWPVLFVLWGLWMLTKPPSARKRMAAAQKSMPPGQGSAQPNQVFGDIKERTTSGTTAYSTVFGDLNVAVESNAYHGGSGSTVFGDGTIDLSGSILSDGEQILRHSAVFGSILVTLPPATAYMLYAHSLFGFVQAAGGEKREGISSTMTFQTPEYASASKRIKLELSTVFGNIIVRA